MTEAARSAQQPRTIDPETGLRRCIRTDHRGMPPHWHTRGPNEDEAEAAQQRGGLDYEAIDVNQRNAIWQVIRVLENDEGGAEQYEAAINLRAVFPKFSAAARSEWCECQRKDELGPYVPCAIHDIALQPSVPPADPRPKESEND